MSDFDFQPYLSAIVDRYSPQRDLYTPTDALLPLEARSVGCEEVGQEKRMEQFPVLAGLRRYALGDEREHVLLAGRPGSGKSTALRQLVVELAADGLVPVLVQLKGDRTVPELIQAEFRRMKQRVTLEQIEDWLMADRLVLLLDGVNEIPNDDLWQSLTQFREDNRTVPMIFTTRDLSLGGNLGIEKRLEMRPLSEPQLREFVGKYLGDKGDLLLGQLHGKLPELAETPLLLKMLCDVFDPETGKIPESKGELFQWFSRKFDNWKEREGVRTSEKFWQWNKELLQHLALIMIQNNGSVLPQPSIGRDEIAKILEKYLTGRVANPGERAKDWRDDLIDFHLLQDAAEPDKIEFHHQLFQEYYAAEALLAMFCDRHPDVVEPERFQHFYLNYLKWTESVAIVLSLMEDEEQEQAVDLVKQALDVDLMLGARLAGIILSPTDINIQKIKRKAWIKRLRGEIPMQSPCCAIETIISLSLPRKVEEHLLYLALNTNINHIQNDNKKVDNEEAIDALIDVVKTTKNYDSLTKAARDLGSLRSEKSVPVLLNFFPVLLEEPFGVEDLCLLQEIESALILIRSEKACSDLINFLQNNNLHSCTRQSAARCLGEIGCKSAVKALARASKDKNLDVRKSSIEALGNIGCKTCVDTLEKATSDVNLSIRWVAKLALAKIGVANESTVVEMIDGLEFCWYHLEDPQCWNYFVDDDGLEVCEETYSVGYDEEISWSAAEALAKLDASILPELRKSLLSKSKDGTPHLHAAMYAISAIQANCKFYNYEIYQNEKLRKADCPSLEGSGGDRIATMAEQISTIDRRTQNMAEQPSSISISGGTFNGPVNLASNQGHQPTTIIDTQINYSTDPNLFQTIQNLLQQNIDLKTFITELETQNPNTQTEAEAEAVRDKAIATLQNNNPSLWKTIRHQMRTLKRQILNPERHAQAAKATLVEVTKAYWEQSLIAKAIVTYIDKLSETPD